MCNQDIVPEDQFLIQEISFHEPTYLDKMDGGT